MLGFMLAAMAVVASISHTHLMRMMQEYGFYDDLLRRLFAGAFVFFVCTLCSGIILFGYVPGTNYRAALVGLHVAALVSLLDVGHKFWMVLKNLRQDADH